jgi:hypothetical protein
MRREQRLRQSNAIHWKQNKVQHENRIDVRQSSKRREQNIAEDRDGAQGHHCGHAECRKNASGCDVAHEVDPTHRHDPHPRRCSSDNGARARFQISDADRFVGYTAVEKEKLERNYSEGSNSGRASMATAVRHFQPL